MSEDMVWQPGRGAGRHRGGQGFEGMAWGVEDTRYVIWAFLLHTACKVAWLCSALCKLSTVVSVLPCWQLHVAWVPNRPTSADRSSSLLVVVAPWQRRSGATTRYLKVQQHGQYTSSCPVDRKSVV